MSGKVRIWVIVPLLVLAVAAGTSFSLFSAGDAPQNDRQEKEKKEEKKKGSTAKTVKPQSRPKLPPPPPPQLRHGRETGKVPKLPKLPKGMKRSIDPNRARGMQRKAAPPTPPQTQPQTQPKTQPKTQPQAQPVPPKKPAPGQKTVKTPDANTKTGKKDSNKKDTAKKQPKKQITPEDIEVIIPISRLDKKWKFTINRNIFSPDPMKPKITKQKSYVAPPPPKPKKPKVNKQEQDEMAAEVRRSLSYEGYVIKNTRNYALVSANGEFFAVGTGDIVLERIKIIEIHKKNIKVEVDSQVFEIQLKGDDDA